MKTLLETIFSSTLATIGIFIAGISFAVAQWRNGGSQASSEVINTYREQVRQLKEEMKVQGDTQLAAMKAQEKTHNEQMTALTSKVGELTGLITVKDNTIKELKELLLEKSPEMLEFYKMGNDYFREAKPILSEIKNHLALAKA